MDKLPLRRLRDLSKVTCLERPELRLPFLFPPEHSHSLSTKPQKHCCGGDPHAYVFGIYIHLKKSIVGTSNNLLGE